MLTSIAFFGYTTNPLSIHLMEKFVFFPVFDFYNIAVVNIHSCISLVNMYFHLSCFLPISGITVMPCPMPKKAIVSYILWFLSVSERMQIRFQLCYLGRSGSLSLIIVITDSPLTISYVFSSCNRFSSVKSAICFPTLIKYHYSFT